MLVLLHSDDMGFTPGITRDIGELWAEGALDGFSVMANGLALDQVQSWLEGSDREARIAVHLNLFEGPALTGVSPATDAQGNLNLGFEALLARTLAPGWRGSSLRRAIVREWDAQIVRVKELVGPRCVAVVDSHVHYHMIPGLFDIACELAAEHGVPEVRLVREPFYRLPKAERQTTAETLLNLVKHVLLNTFALVNRRTAQRHDVEHPDGVIGVLHTGKMTESTIRCGIARAEALGYKRLEVFTHVGRASESELEAWPSSAAQRVMPLAEARSVERAAVSGLAR